MNNTIFTQVQFDAIPNPPRTLGERIVVDIYNVSRRQFDPSSESSKCERYELHRLRGKIMELVSLLEAHQLPKPTAEEIVADLTVAVATGRVSELNKSACIAVGIILRTTTDEVVLREAQVLMTSLMGSNNKKLLRAMRDGHYSQGLVDQVAAETVTLFDMGLVTSMVICPKDDAPAPVLGLTQQGFMLVEFFNTLASEPVQKTEGISS